MFLTKHYRLPSAIHPCMFFAASHLTISWDKLVCLLYNTHTKSHPANKTIFISGLFTYIYSESICAELQIYRLLCCLQALNYKFLRLNSGWPGGRAYCHRDTEKQQLLNVQSSAPGTGQRQGFIKVWKPAVCERLYTDAAPEVMCSDHIVNNSLYKRPRTKGKSKHSSALCQMGHIIINKHKRSWRFCQIWFCPITATYPIFY